MAVCPRIPWMWHEKKNFWTTNTWDFTLYLLRGTLVLTQAPIFLRLSPAWSVPDPMLKSLLDSVELAKESETMDGSIFFLGDWRCIIEFSKYHFTVITGSGWNAMPGKLWSIHDTISWQQRRAETAWWWRLLLALYYRGKSETLADSLTVWAMPLCHIPDIW